MLMSYFTIEFKVLLRKRLYLIMSICLPLFFYLLFTSILDLPKSERIIFYKEYMYSMVVFSCMNFCLISFPVDMIEERTNGWFKHLMTTPLNITSYYLVKVSKTTFQFLLAIVLIFVVAHFYNNVNMEMIQWIKSAVILWIDASLLLTLGLIIAQFNDTQKASSIANLIGIGLAILGGLWFPTNTFPDWLQTISKLTPTYHLKQLAYRLSKGDGIDFTSFGIIFFYSVIFLMIALLINKQKAVD
ncbi:ABC transporter permease [Staphylococcus warneri]|uniref:ABC transporter permease n=2 Tax=Staphylococcus warneri TaxID=1292 RepID=A0A8B2ZLY3_STAWA|nr:MULTISPECIES: ABC transporter permease [Staphylococcus]KKI61838.1 ABC transporter permease protein [Staphylococcus warneri]KTW19714.1 ABC transporter permease [Staphylococcus warneri]MBF2177144.1 ABC transporter permease [Staphylococcus warneri]MBF2180354.1 ABC transporter permease [Staphylococcus warneri]MBF2184019.1 ABC transporter permease [Staphylococcus warneri]